MKKILLLSLLFAISSTTFFSCSNEEEEDLNDFNKEVYSRFSVKGNWISSYSHEAFPQSNMDDKTDGIIVEKDDDNSNIINIKIPKGHKYDFFYVGMKKLTGYFKVYTVPYYAVYSNKRINKVNEDDEYFVIPLEFNTETNGTLIISGADDEGNISKPFEATINYESKHSGAEDVTITTSVMGYSMSETKIRYDKEGRLVSVKIDDSESYGELEIVYNPMKITYSTRSYDEDELESTSFAQLSDIKLNNDGYISNAIFTNNEGSNEKIDFVYDSKGHLLKMGSLFNYSWSGENLTKVTALGNTSWVIKYGNEVNTHNQFTYSSMYYDTMFVGLLSSGLLGKTSRNLVAGIEINGYNEEGELTNTTLNVSYKLNSDGTIKTEEISFQNMSSIICNYKYN